MRKTFLGILMAVACISFASCEGEPAPVKKLPEELVNSIGMKFRLIQPGSFLMGSEKGDFDMKPVHRVTLTKPFCIGVYEVTQEEWGKVMSVNPSYVKGTKNPVERVNWGDAQEFARRLSRKEKARYRLPTEAEWEYACRAGTTTEFYWGDDPDGDKIRDYAWYEGNSENTTRPVGQKKPNAWGLYDMSGSVWEWCQDWYGRGYPEDKHAVDPKGPASGSDRVVRGGSWYAPPEVCRSARRAGCSPSYRRRFVGFRLVRAVADIHETEDGRGGEARRYATAYYYCTSCKKEFVADASEVPPTECPTCKRITGVLLRKYQCKKCRTVFPGYLCKYDAATKQAIERRSQGERVSDSEIGNSLLAEPESDNWMDSTTQGVFALLANIRCPKCQASGADLEAIFPE